jgi:hypothetical protein
VTLSVVPVHNKEEDMSEMPIDQILDSLAERLGKATKDPKVGGDLAFDIKQFSGHYSKLIHQMRQCQNVSKNLDTIVTAVIPLGKKLASDVWNTLEMMGLWNAETESISDLLTKTLVTDRFIDDSVDAIIGGCECRKKGDEGPLQRADIVTKVPKEYRL